MIVHLLIAQRKGNAKAPEVLDVADEYTMEVNPDWMQERLDHHCKANVYVCVTVLKVSVSDRAIETALNPPEPAITVGVPVK